MPKETESISVHPASEAYAINVFQSFGWELLSSQEVYNRDSHLEERRWSGDIYSVTETTHYVKLVFQRDRSMRNYDRLVELENKFADVPSAGEPPWKCSTKWLLIWIFGGAFLSVGIGTVIGVILLIYNNTGYKKKLSIWENRRDALAKKEAQIINTAKQLTSSTLQRRNTPSERDSTRRNPLPPIVFR